MILPILILGAGCATSEKRGVVEFRNEEIAIVRLDDHDAQRIAFTGTNLQLNDEVDIEERVNILGGTSYTWYDRSAKVLNDRGGENPFMCAFLGAWGTAFLILVLL